MSKLFFRRRTFVAVLVLLVVTAAFHAKILAALAIPVSLGDEPVEASHLLFLRSAQAASPAFPFARDFAAQDSNRRILILRDFVRRTEAIGAGPPFVETTIARLQDAGIPLAQIQVIGDPHIITTTESITFVANWLDEQTSDAEVLIITHLFRAGYVTSVTNKNVPPTLRARMHVLGFERYGVNRSNWWKNATGIKNFLSESLRRFHLVVFGEPRPDVSWDPDRYEQALRNLQP